MKLFIVDTDDHMSHLPFNASPRHKRNTEIDTLTHAGAHNNK